MSQVDCLIRSRIFTWGQNLTMLNTCYNLMLPIKEPIIHCPTSHLEDQVRVRKQAFKDEVHPSSPAGLHPWVTICCYTSTLTISSISSNLFIRVCSSMVEAETHTAQLSCKPMTNGNDNVVGLKFYDGTKSAEYAGHRSLRLEYDDAEMEIMEEGDVQDRRRRRRNQRPVKKATSGPVVPPKPKLDSSKGMSPAICQVRFRSHHVTKPCDISHMTV